MPKKTAREIPFSTIEEVFDLASYFLGASFCPAVKKDDSGYSIRILRSETVYGVTTNTTYDYFKLSADGAVITAPRGYAKDFKPGRITGMEDAAAKYSAPDASTIRIGL